MAAKFANNGSHGICSLEAQKQDSLIFKMAKCLKFTAIKYEYGYNGSMKVFELCIIILNKITEKTRAIFYSSYVLTQCVKHLKGWKSWFVQPNQVIKTIIEKKHVHKNFCGPV